MPRLSKVGAAALAAFGWTGISTVSASYLVVAGGGGAGGDLGAGGGAGGLLTGTATLNTTLSYTITVGAGGAGDVNAINGINGSNSAISIVSVTSIGGGGGAGDTSKAGNNGGSGGGGQGVSAGTGTVGQGNNGGIGQNGSAGGGGGGASSAGGAGTVNNGGNGGSGTASSISGSSITYAGGGGGGGSISRGGSAGTGGSGGGGNGNGTSAGAGSSGTANLGGGGGGGSISGGDGGNGGSGVVIVSYPAPQRFGGGVVTASGSNVIHTFNTSGTLSPLTASSTLSANFLVVAGGGGGATSVANKAGNGGGGAGGFRTSAGTSGGGASAETPLTIDTNSIYIVTVGAGGVSPSSGDSVGGSGSNSVFFSVTSIGGGGGGPYNATDPTTGGSGGGSGRGPNVGAAGTANQGYAGGNGYDGSPYRGGGGGGAGSVGASGQSSGNGGSGVASSISGSSVTYAGGGGGGSFSGTGGSGGTGGGGAGGNNSPTAGTDGTSNLGAGGGGGGDTSGSAAKGGNGGSGVVIISYAGSTQQMAGGTVTISGGNVIHTFTSSGYLTPIKYVNNSLRIRASASAYLSRTQTSGNRRTYTYSAWVKRGNLTTKQNLFGTIVYPTPSNYQSYWSFLNDNTIEIALYSGSSYLGQLITTQVFRDPAAWYHIVVQIDTTQATSSNRIKLFVNGVQVTSFSTTNYPSQNTDTFINTDTYQVGIGRVAPYNTTEYFDGYMAEVNFVDGQALTPNSFGTFNSYGVWQPITYGGSYGTNGFYLPFSNTTSATTLGYDFSPNGNNWTTNNISGTSAVSTIRTFTSSTTWTAPSGVTSVNYLVVAGGGGGYIAGGGAGGLRTGTLSVTPGSTYTVTIGAGGGAGSNGNDSTFSSITSLGGGNGFGSSGGSGGGGNYGNGAGGSGTSGQGNNGGTGSTRGGGGGGGAGSAGSAASGAENGGNGGSGSTVSSVLGGGTYAGGGGGGATTANGSTPGTGGSGGGGNGSRTSSNGTAGGVNTGGGSGGNATGLANSDPGGSGIVIISYSQDSMTDVPTLTSATAANFNTLNPLNTKGSPTISNGNLTATYGSSQSSVSGTIGVNSGKFYAEFIPSSVSNTVHFGVFALGNNSNGPDVGTGQNSRVIYASNGSVYTSTVAATYATYTTGDVIGVALNMDSLTVAFYKNNSLQGTINMSSSYSNWTFAVLLNGGTDAGNTNYGQQPFIYTPPSGFVALNTYNM
jgi:hypothetical protein